jgi:hypothetical protein
LPAHDRGGRPISTNATRDGTRITTEDGTQIYYKDRLNDDLLVFLKG